MDKTYARFVVTVSASVEDINALSDSVENLTQALVEDIDDKCTVYNGSTIRVKFNELKGYDYSQPAEQGVQSDECPTCTGLGFVNDDRGRRGVDCSDCNGSGIRR